MTCGFESWSDPLRCKSNRPKFKDFDLSGKKKPTSSFLLNKGEYCLSISWQKD